MSDDEKDERKSTNILLRVSESEKKAIEKKALKSKVTVSELLRDSVLKKDDG